MTTNTLLLFAIVIFSLVGFLIFLMTRKKENTSEQLLKLQMENLQNNLDASSKLVHQQMTSLMEVMDKRLHESSQLMEESNKNVGQRLDNAARVVGEVQKSLGRMEESTKQIFDVGKDIASLQDILKAPKLRGNLGELFLGDLLSQVLPPDRYKLQHEFSSREKVDAVIHSAQGMIPVDSKFPLENFLRIIQQSNNEDEKRAVRKVFLNDVKKHIDKIAQKYILPHEGTLDIALMYIPAENVYYEILIRQEEGEKDLIRYAQEKRVYPVSPNSFYAYLQTIAMGFKGMKIEERAHEIMKDLASLKKDFGDFGDRFQLVGKHLSNAKGSFEEADKKLQKFGDKMQNLVVGEGPDLRLVEGKSL